LENIIIKGPANNGKTEFLNTGKIKQKSCEHLEVEIMVLLAEYLTPLEGESFQYPYYQEVNYLFLGCLAN
jgi:hypothetical protein